MAFNTPTPINPQGFTNQNNISAMFGTAVPGTFNRDLTPGVPQNLQIPSDPLTGQPIDPLVGVTPNGPVTPPLGVQTPTTPIYDINNQ